MGKVLYSASSNGLVDLFLNALALAPDPSAVEVDTLGQGRFASAWTRDDRFYLYIAGGRAIARSDLRVAPVGRPEEARPLLSSPFAETHGQVDPSGAWLVHTSNETGRLEVYADRFPDGGAKRVVSPDGGGWPRWSSDGSEIFYLTPDNELMAVSVRATRAGLEVSPPQPLFALRARPPVRLDAYAYDVAPGARRFLVNTLIEDPGSTMVTLVQNWTADVVRP